MPAVYPAGCYAGGDPYDNDRGRMAIWKWITQPSGIDPVTGLETGGGINEGRSFRDIHDSVNNHFYGGVAKSEWITDKIAARKTPLQPFVMRAWAAENNRRVVVNQARGLTNDILVKQKQGTIERGLRAAFDFPRNIAVIKHGVTFAVTHPGDLAFQPRNMGLFFSQLFHTWDKAFPVETSAQAMKRTAAVEIMLHDMKTDSLHDIALHSRLRIGESNRGENLLSGKSGSTERAWSLLKITRFKLFKSEMELWMKKNPAATEEQTLAQGRHIAEMANHATGTGSGWVPLPRKAMFGPGLTASKISRVITDPYRSIIDAFFNPNAAPEAKYIAHRRMSRAVQYLTTLGGFLATNYGLNKAFGVKDEDNINWTNPQKADWMAFKTGGLEWSVPGLHTELKFLAGIVAISLQQFHSQKQINKESRGWGQWGELAKVGGQYALNKMVPGGQIATELALGHNWQGRPLPFPWIDQTGNKFATPFGANPNLKGAAHFADASIEYALSHAPIPFTAPIKYIYDGLRGKGASAHDAMDVIRGIVLFGMGLTGLHGQPDWKLAQEEAKKKQAAKQPAH